MSKTGFFKVIGARKIAVLITPPPYKRAFGMEERPKHRRFALCKKPLQKTPIQQEITVFPNQSQSSYFSPFGQGSCLGKLFKNHSILKSTFKGVKL